MNDYRVEPHHLVGYHGNWYVLATNTRNGRTETFALSRFRSVASTGDRFVRPAGYDARDVIRTADLANPTLGRGWGRPIPFRRRRRGTKKARPLRGLWGAAR